MNDSNRRSWTNLPCARLFLFVLCACGLICKPAIADSPRGMIGVGTWATQAEFKDIVVTKGDQTLLSVDLSKGLEGWHTSRGQWAVQDGVLRQTGDEENARAMIGDPTWSDYTLTLKARKLSGNEGFLILFDMPSADSEIKSWWNIGGWGNTRHAIEVPGVSSEPVDGSIKTGQWYDIKIELSGGKVRAYLDGQLVQSGELSPLQTDLGHALIPDLLADPSIVDINGTYCCYATTDGAGRGLATSGVPVVWKSKDFVHWSFSGSIFPNDFDAKYWAPSKPINKDGRWYLFPTLNNIITAVSADSPDGPFCALDGRHIAKGTGWQQFPIKVGHPIDAEILRDDDGSYYMAWSQRYIAKLNGDMSGFDGEPTLIQTKRDGYSEGPCLIKRNGIYYYLYTLGGSEKYQYAYMLSRTSPRGPWTAPQDDIIATTDLKEGIFGPGHGCVFKPSDSQQWYFVYLEYGRGGTNRQIFADRLNFNADGTIQPVKLTSKGVGAIREDPAYQSPNLAVGKQVLASSTLPDYRVPPTADQGLNRVERFSAENAVDGSNGSRWMARGDDQQAWFQLDLGKSCDVQRTELYFVQPTAGQAYKLECSSDGQNWVPYGGHEDVQVKSPHTDVKSTRTRYLRVTILKGVAGLWEFGVY